LIGKVRGQALEVILPRARSIDIYLLPSKAIESRGANPVTTTILDATGLKCPLPVLRARKAMKAVDAGGLLEVKATDPGAVADFQSFCETTGAELVEWREDGGVFLFVIRKAA
jgi:tRNA 2-thiouridine synthesizing protein A